MRFRFSIKRIDTLKKSMLKIILEKAPHIQEAKENQLKILRQKFSQFNDWYKRAAGLNELLLAQEKVTALQNQLLQIQEKRHDVGNQLREVRQKSMALHDEVHKVTIQNDLEMLLDLMERETELLKLEKSISKSYQEFNQTEHELFTEFTDSIRDSHEKQKAQSEMNYIKYFGISMSITGTIFTFIYLMLQKKEPTVIVVNKMRKFKQIENVAPLSVTILEKNGNVRDIYVLDNTVFVAVIGIGLGAWLLVKMIL